nr:MAG TPA: hypothetical protein [Caudoviricetes sp.]
MVILQNKSGIIFMSRFYLIDIIIRSLLPHNI